MNTTDANRTAQSTSLPNRGEEIPLFGPPPLFEGEDAKAYDELLMRISSAVKPVDILEDIWVRDLVDLTWDAFRLRRLKASVMTTNAHKGLSETLAPLVGGSDAQTLAEAWAARQSDVVEQVDKALGTAGLNMDAVMAQTLCLKLDEIERIDRMIAISEARRNTTLREIDRHRETLGQKLRRAMEQLEDRQLRMIESPSIDGTNAK
jgi:hypothetical protein